MDKHTIVKIYIGSLLLYYCIGAWFNAKNKLIQYRENKLDFFEKEHIKDEWSAVKYGAYHNFIERIYESLFWPVKIITNIIPFMVLQLNPPSTKTEISQTDKQK